MGLLSFFRKQRTLNTNHLVLLARSRISYPTYEEYLEATYKPNLFNYTEQRRRDEASLIMGGNYFISESHKEIESYYGPHGKFNNLLLIDAIEYFVCGACHIRENNEYYDDEVFLVEHYSRQLSDIYIHGDEKNKANGIFQETEHYNYKNGANINYYSAMFAITMRETVYMEPRSNGPNHYLELTLLADRAALVAREIYTAYELRNDLND